MSNQLLGNHCRSERKRGLKEGRGRSPRDSNIRKIDFFFLSERNRVVNKKERTQID